MCREISDTKLFSDIKQLVEQARHAVSQTVITVSSNLVREYGSSFSEKNLRRMMQFNEIFPDRENVATLWRHLSWAHFKLIIPIKDQLQRNFNRR